MTLLLLPAALAHVPHDQVVAVAAGAGAPWYVVLQPGQISLLLRSDDAGETWTYVGGPPTADELVAAATLSDGTPVLLGTSRYWWVEEDEWQSEALPGAVSLAAVDGEALLLAGEGGVWAGAPGALEQERDDPIFALSEGMALDSTGGVLTRDGGIWTDLPGPGREAAVAWSPEGPLVGDRDGAVWAWRDESWQPCAALPTAAGDHPAIRRLATNDAGWWALRGDGALVVSDDACDTWTELSNPLTAEYGSIGGPLEAEAWTHLGVVDGTVIVAGWDGLATGNDDTWQTATLVPPDYTRGLVFSPSFAADGTIWWGGDAAGVAITDDGGTTFRAPDEGLEAPNVQDLKVWGGRRLFAIVGHQLQVSDDGGERWRALRTPFVSDIAVIPRVDEDEVWASGHPGTAGDPTMAASTDGGATWTLAPDLPDARRLVHVTPTAGADLVCATTSTGELSCSDGGAWTSRWDGGEPLLAFAWPAGAPTRLVVADALGAHLSDDGGETWTDTSLPPDDPPVEGAPADDGTLFLTTRSGVLLRSTDGGERWDELGIRFAAAPMALSPRPDFAHHPDLLVGAPDGAWLVRDADATPTLERWGGWMEIHLGRSEFYTCPDCPEAEEVDGFESGMGLRVPDGATLEAMLRGHTLTITGTLPDGSSARVVIDGETVGTVTAGDPLFTESGLEDRWHRVRVEGTGGEGVLLEGLQARGEGGSLTIDVPDLAEGGCGCGSGSAAWFLLIPALARRRGTPSA